MKGEIIELLLEAICCEGVECRFLRADLCLIIDGRKISSTFKGGNELELAAIDIFGENKSGRFYLQGDFEREGDVLFVKEVRCLDVHQYERGLEKIALLVKKMLNLSDFSVDFSNVKSVKVVKDFDDI